MKERRRGKKPGFLPRLRSAATFERRVFTARSRLLAALAIAILAE
jgi:hypothetical protein